MNRFFINAGGISGAAARIHGEDVKHISRVLRLGVGDEVMLCDGAGMEHLTRIQAIEKDMVLLSILQSKPAVTEPQHRVTLYQGLPKAGKMDLIIQKCVEIGVFSIVPVAMQRSIVRFGPGEFEPKRTRCQRVAYEAAKQARRGIIPQVATLLPSVQAMDLTRYDLILVADEDENSVSLKDILRLNKDATNIALLIGPEGGLSRSEADALRLKGGHCVSLGPRILRTETAGMAALAMILYELEDMK